MNPLRGTVHVAGIGETGPVKSDERSIPEMVLDAVGRALDDSGLGYENIDAVVTASVDLLDGLTASNIAVTEVVGAVMKPETRIAADGLGALIHAACQVASGAYGAVLVAAHCKPSMSDYQSLTQWAMDPVHIQPLGVDFLTCAALQAQALKSAEPDCEEKWASVAAERRADTEGMGLLPICTAQDVAASPYVASPIRAEMCAPLGDGACAVILSAKTNRQGDPDIVIAGLGHDLEAHALGERELTRWVGLERACRRAYAMAGISGPADVFTLAEPSCWFPHEEALFLQAAGLGDGVTISPDGGLWAGAVPVVAGLSRLIAATRRMRLDEDQRASIVHGAWGPAGQGQAVAILERSA